MFHRMLVFGFLLVLQQNCKLSFSSPLQSFDPMDFLGLEESRNEFKRSERPGQCPVSPAPNECPPHGEQDSCDSDDDCSLPKKCCSDGCGKLCRDPENDETCKDDRDDCDSIPLEGETLMKYCKKWENYPSIQQCKKTCGLCKPPSPTGCEDKRNDCDWILRNAGHYLPEYCQQHKDDSAVKECPKTCGFCRKIPSPTKLPPKPPAPQTPPVATEEPGVKPGPEPTKNPEGVQLTGFQRECLEAHNKYRALHSAPPLVWSAELTEDAEKWANYLAHENKFYHDPDLKKLDEGENLAWFFPARKECNGPSDENCVHCGEMVKDWYDEELDYDFNQGRAKSPFDVVTHFTQVVWKGTSELGMATAVANNRLVTVARYRKPGNKESVEDFKKNVLKANEP